MNNKSTIILKIISLLRVSTLLCHPQGTCNQYFAKLQKYFKCSCVTWPAVDYKLLEDDTIVSKHVGL
jgi:hypothetical protein